MKTKIYFIASILILAIVSYYGFCAYWENRQLRSNLVTAQTEIAEQEGFVEAGIKRAGKLTTENEKLQEKVDKLKAAGMKTLTVAGIKTEEKEIELEKKIKTPDEIKEKYPDIPDTIIIPCKLNLSLTADIIAMQSVDQKIWWQGIFKVYDSGELIAELEPDYSASKFDFSRKQFREKWFHAGWQLGVGFSCDPFTQEFHPAVYFGWGITF